MPTNVYFDTGTTNEQRLYEDLYIEQLKIYGQDVYYLPRKIANKDTIFGEDPASSFDDSYIIEMYVDNTDGYMGEQEIIKKFGLELRDDIVFTLSKSRWETLIGNNSDLVADRPQEGDLIYSPILTKLFEVSFVDHDDPFHQLDNNPVYKLRCKQYEYSQEAIDTGITVLDNIETDLSADVGEHQFTLEQSSTYNEGLEINDTVNTFGVLLEETDGDQIIMEDETTSAGENILLENSADSGDKAYLLQETYIVGDASTTSSDLDKSAQNELFDQLDDDVLDFSETNPFGDAGGT